MSNFVLSIAAYKPSPLGLIHHVSHEFNSYHECMNSLTLFALRRKMAPRAIQPAWNKGLKNVGRHP